MKLFQMKTAPLGIERMTEFVQDNYVCAGYPGIGDLEQASREEIARRLQQTYAYYGPELEKTLDSLDIFVHTMQDGDYVLISDGSGPTLAAWAIISMRKPATIRKMAVVTGEGSLAEELVECRAESHDG